MAATNPINSTIEGKKVFTKLHRVLVTPLDASGAKTATAYALDNIVADSTAISQDDPDRQEIKCETRDENIYEAITLGKYQFKCDNADWQNDLLSNVLGWTVDSANKVIVAPTSYREVYAEIELQFDDPATYSTTAAQNTYRGSIVLPKVLLASKATMESLKTSTGNMTVSGTAYTGQVRKYSANSAQGVVVDGSMAPIYYSEGPITHPTAS